MCAKEKGSRGKRARSAWCPLQARVASRRDGRSPLRRRRCATLCLHFLLWYRTIVIDTIYMFPIWRDVLMQTHIDKSGRDENLKPITVRFSSDAWDAIRDIAAENKISQAELVRMAVSGNLEKYLGTIRIVDKDEATKIREAILALLSELTKIQLELNRIGVNYNQEIRLRQIEKKYPNDSVLKAKAESTIKRDCNSFSIANIDAIMTRYESALKRVGDILCHILT